MSNPTPPNHPDTLTRRFSMRISEYGEKLLLVSIQNKSEINWIFDVKMLLFFARFHLDENAIFSNNVFFIACKLVLERNEELKYS